MTRVFLLSLLVALCIPGADRKRKPPKPPDVEVLDASGHRTEGKVALDGRVRNTSGKPIAGLVLLFDFMAPGRAVITTQKTTIDEEVLDPGKESIFRVEMNDPVRAVEFQIACVDKAGRDLRVANSGPFVIE